MILSIYKYPLKITDRQVLTLPTGSRILTVQAQYDHQLNLWALVNMTESRMTDGATTQEARQLEEWEIIIIGTGNSADVLLGMHAPLYLCTTQMEEGRLVWHIFTRTVAEAALARKVHDRVARQRAEDLRNSPA